MTGHRVLIIDDDPALLDSLSEALRLRMAGVTIETADSGAIALEQVASQAFDAVVTDIKMPGIDGVDLLAQVRAFRPDMPVLMITGYPEEGLAIQALRGGAYDIIRKPIDRDFFISTLNRAIVEHVERRSVRRWRAVLERCAGELSRIVESLLARPPRSEE